MSRLPAIGAGVPPSEAQPPVKEAGKKQ